MKALEQMLEQVQGTRQTIDVYATGTATLYTSPVNPSGSSCGQIVQTNYGNNVIGYGNLSNLGGDVHDTFKLDRYDNTYGGHTTVNIPGYTKLHIPWNE